MSRFGAVGPSYPSQSPNADAQRTINWIPEPIESGNGKSAYALYRSPGTKKFASLPGNRVPTLLFTEDRCFACSGVYFCEIAKDGSMTNWSQKSNVNLVDDRSKPYMASSGLMVMIVSGGSAYSFDLKKNVLTAISIDSTKTNTIQGPVSQCFYADGYFFALLKDTNSFQISKLLDDTSWSALDVGTISVFPDNIVGMIINQRQPWFFGSKQSQVYYDSGAVNFPYSPVPGGFIEGGLGAADSPVKADNSIFWVDADDRGGGMVRRASGYIPARQSNHAVETEVQGFPTFADCITYSYQENGHTQIVFFFPSAISRVADYPVGTGATWVFDVSNGLWHERRWANGDAHHSMCHAYASSWNGGIHLVGDWASGTVYQMSSAFFGDEDSGGKAIPIIRTRITPHISKEQTRISHTSLQIDCGVGLGPLPPLLDGRGEPRAPQLLLRYSDNATHSWSNWNPLDVGQAGQGKYRVIARRLGQSRDRIYLWQVSDPIDWSVTDLYLNGEPDFAPRKRIAAQLAEQA